MDAPISKNIYAVNTDGSAEEKLTEDNHSSAPVLSPDGSRIAYVHIKAETCEGCLIPAEYELYVMNADGTDPHFVAASEEPLPYISWSPDGKEISYVGWLKRQLPPRAFSGSPLYLFSVGSSESPKLLIEDVVRPIDWSPDGTWIAYGCTAARTNGQAQIRLCLTEVSNPGNSRVLPEGTTSGISWSPDSTRIAFVVWSKTAKSIFVARTDDSPPKLLTGTNWILTKPLWSPDGQKILFEDMEKRKGTIFVINADGSARQRLTDSKLRASNPSWSPDGKQIAFAGAVHDWLQVHLVNPDGSSLRQITHDKKMGCSVHDWLPNSTLLLISCGYLKSPHPDPEPFDIRLCVLDIKDPQGLPRQLVKSLHTTYSFAPLPRAPKSAPSSTP
jgi:Tol biopolymer transport system component